MIKILIVWVVVLFAVMILTPLDDSDTSWWDRSGVSVSVDHATGCEYLSKMFGGITPRMNADGKTQRGCKK